MTLHFGSKSKSCQIYRTFRAPPSLSFCSSIWKAFCLRWAGAPQASKKEFYSWWDKCPQHFWKWWGTTEPSGPDGIRSRASKTFCGRKSGTTNGKFLGLLFEYLGYSNKCSIFGILRRIPNTDIRKLANEYHYSIFDVSFVIFEYLSTLVFGASKISHRPDSVAVRVLDLQSDGSRFESRSGHRFFWSFVNSACFEKARGGAGVDPGVIFITCVRASRPQVQRMGWMQFAR